MNTQRQVRIDDYHISCQPRRRFLWGVACFLAGLQWATAVGAQSYAVIDLGTLGGTSTTPRGINDSGQVTGHARTTGDQSTRAFLWHNGVMHDLGTLGGLNSSAFAINESGQSVGSADLPPPNLSDPSLWTPGVPNGTSGTMSSLATLTGGFEARAFGINKSGQAVGRATTDMGNVHAVLWHNGGISDLGSLRGSDRNDISTTAYATAINESGQVVGASLTTDASIVVHAFLWQSGGMSDLGTLGGTHSLAYGINKSGQVVGGSSTASGSSLAFLWQSGGMSSLGTLGGAGSEATAINDSGLVVGSSSTATNTVHAFIWKNGAMQDLNDLIDPSAGWVLSQAMAINNAGQIVGVGTHNGQSRGFLLQPRRLPVLIVPGVGATYAADVTNDLPWLIQRGVDPSMLQIDPLARTYHDLIKTLENVGYVQGKDLFVVNYDWRLSPGPDDGSIDGTVGGLTAAAISSQVYRYGVDYFGAALRQAAEQWEIDHPGEALDAVDVIVHSTGGLVARTYIQSAAYGGVYTGAETLPKINNLVMIGVPNRGASKAWNPLHDNWVVDPAFEFVLAKIVNRAYRKVLNGAVIGGLDHNISLASLSPPTCLEPPKVCFVNQYIPTARSLLATYDFIDFGAGFTNVNANPAARNSLLLDLNAGLDLSLVGDPNAFAGLVLAKPTIIFGTNGGDALGPIPGLPSGTPTAVTERVGPAGGSLGFLSIASFADVGPRDATAGEVWFDDALVPVSGDGTVPLESARNQFVGDNRINLMPFTKGGNTMQSVGHTDLPYNTDVQQAILDLLSVGCPAPCNMISLGLSTLAPSAVQCAVTGCTNFMLDPVEGFIVDNQGRRLGYSTATGPITEIPGSVWYGNADGMGWVFGPIEQPLTLELIGLGGPYYAMVSVLAPTGRSGVVDEGVLGVGVPRVVPVPQVSNPSLTVSKTGSGSGMVTSNIGGINCGGTCTDEYPFTTNVTLTAAPTPGHQFTGWLGPCTGTGACTHAVSGSTTATATFALTPIGATVLDVDDEGSYDALTDGLLALRYLFGLSGSSLISNAVGQGAGRDSDVAIANYLADAKPLLDIDGNGQADALTDGLLIIRCLFGLRGESLIHGAVGDGMRRTTATDIETYIQFLAPQ